MADFSKQWCEIHDPNMPWDFDIEVEAEAIPKGYYKPMICEGFGFLGIGVDIDGNIEIFGTRKIVDQAFATYPMSFRRVYDYQTGQVLFG